jgi:hypothetical protein
MITYENVDETFSEMIWVTPISVHAYTQVLDSIAWRQLAKTA